MSLERAFDQLHADKGGSRVVIMKQPFFRGRYIIYRRHTFGADDELSTS